MVLQPKHIVFFIGFVWPQLGFTQVVINEILPDPAGSDAGKEFVELYNSGTEAVSLAGVRFQFANGAEGPSWETRWTGNSTDILPGLGRFLIVDRNWAGPSLGDAQVRLSLQNGPDAVRLVRDDTVLDLVGYGALTCADLFEGRPIALEVGLSLARRPDGGDTNDNAADFRQEAPSPGQPNFLPYQLTITSWSLDPPSSDRPGQDHRLEANFVNTGLEGLDQGSLTLVVEGQRYEALVGDIPSGHDRTALWTFRPLATGQVALSVECLVDGGRDTLRLALGFLQVGPGPLVLNEVQPVPEDRQGEWIELASTVGYPLDLGSFMIGDADGELRNLPAGTVDPYGLVTLAQDSSALADWIRANRDNQDPGFVGCRASDSPLLSLDAWPTLNNTAPVTRDFADRISLADSVGTIIDHLTYAPDVGDAMTVPLPEDGQSLERMSLVPQGGWNANWGPCALGSGGTPGCPNSYPAVGVGVVPMTLSSRVLDKNGGTGALGITLFVPAAGSGTGLQIFNLWGELVRDLGRDRQGPGTRIRYWTGVDDGNVQVPPGGYVIVGQIMGPDGQILSRSKMLVGVR